MMKMNIMLLNFIIMNSHLFNKKVGVEFEGPVGLNDGSVDGKRYFNCPPLHGSFLRPDKLVYLEEVYEDE